MGRVCLTCFSRSLLRDEKPSSSDSNGDGEAIALSSLAADIQMLQTSLAQYTLSLHWCIEATKLLRKLHSLFLSFLDVKEKAPALRDGANCLDEYMKESLNFLDLCNLLKPRISSMGRYRLATDFATKRLRDGGLMDPTSKIEMEIIERETKKLYAMEEHEHVNLFEVIRVSKSKRMDGNTRVVHTIKTTINIICMLLFSALVYPISEIHCEPPSKSISFLLKKLVFSFGEGVNSDNSCVSVLAETMMVERAILDLKTQLLKGAAAGKEKLENSIDVLKRRSGVLQEGLEKFESVLAELFGDIVKGRNRILGLMNPA